MDTKLICRAQTLSGGKVHTVASVIQAIYVADEGLKTDSDNEYWKELLERNEAKLRIFVATGKIGYELPEMR